MGGRKPTANIGMVYNEWTVLRRSENRNSTFAYFECKCSCGTIKSIRGRTLTINQSKSCGCLKRLKSIEYQKTDRPKILNRIRQERWLSSKGGKLSVKKRQEKYRKTEKSKIRAKRYWKSDKGLRNARFFANLRRLLVKQQTPKWANKDEIKLFYTNCPKGLVIDHIIPLKGKNVCGLHVETNLQYLTNIENSKKGNRY